MVWLNHEQDLAGYAVSVLLRTKEHAGAVTSDGSVLHAIPVSSQQQASPHSTSCIYGRRVKMPPELMYGSPNLPRLTQSRYSAELKQSLDDAYSYPSQGENGIQTER